MCEDLDNVTDIKTSHIMERFRNFEEVIQRAIIESSWVPGFKDKLFGIKRTLVDIEALLS